MVKFIVYLSDEAKEALDYLKDECCFDMQRMTRRWLISEMESQLKLTGDD